MSIRMLETGIAAIQAGNKAEGARFLRIALKQGELTGALAATAFLWLAECVDEPARKRAYYNDALNADPGNPDATQRLAAVLAPRVPDALSAPPAHAPEMHHIPSTASGRGNPADQVVAVIGGPNGPGTAFYAHPDGLLATTRYVVGGMERVTVELGDRRQVLAQVISAWPEMDVAILRVEQGVPEVLPITSHPRIPPETPLLVVSARGQQIQGKQRDSRRVMAAHWITTDFLRLPDAGGDPLFDTQGYLVGMMTKNCSRASAYLFGVHIGAIRRCVDQVVQALNGERRNYCPGCGGLSRATAAGYFYCEICGGVAPQARQLHRFPQGDPFSEPSRVRCSYCGAQVGYYGGRCLRCGQGAAAGGQA